MTIAFVALAAAVWLGPLRSSGRVRPPDRMRLGRVRPRLTPPPAELAWLPLLLDLIAAGLESGLPLDAALIRATPDRLPWLRERLGQAAGLLRLGADPQQAWRPLAAHSAFRPLVATAVRSATSGVRLAANISELATVLRTEVRSTRLARAERAAVWVIVPLGLCFLPAFVCIGVIPIVIGIASAGLGR